MRTKKHQGLLSHPYFPMWVFAVFTIGGCFFIAVSKWFRIDPILSMSVPILLMLTYLTLSTITGKLRLHDEQTGDNLYYMGFLYTLSSLGMALYQFGSDASTDAVVKNFGIAITSTITGIALRILYNQMRRDPADIERSARHELADMTRRVRAEMENVTREFSDFRRVSNQMLEEGFDEIAKQAERNGEHIRTILDKLAMEAIKPIQEAAGKLGGAMQSNFDQIEGQFTAIAKRVETGGDLLEKANSSMSISVDRLGTQADVVAAKLERVVVPEEVLKNDLAPMVKALGNAVAQYAVKTETASVEQQSRMAEIGNVLQGVANTTAKALHMVGEHSERAAAAAEKTAEAVNSQQQLIEVLARVVQKQSQDTNELVAKLLAGRQPNAYETRPATQPAAAFAPTTAGPGILPGVALPRPAPEPVAVFQPLDGVLPPAPAEASRIKGWFSR
ncbi:MAG: hypothetical protein EOS07_07420 [Mesorhizobium sp.]|uniref:hypothetical protein n=1 Tax=Mesorhizobium sp. TaxID=1871066 RepID=UPI000FE42E2D|nr:hypothetical protein [Mesorhizobium sp.]RWO10980.1 MAG: hypothetical protein EOS07_07420 [Mesorhizobium sp.]RWP07896.1 MAG: hypothetical protein EOQ99_04030 [Mesorhizobium sp.]RWQ22709.1 MAG: hypothetical protein EOR92_06755 [Mesorhizobium sp.]RWQ55240.1 MAG: hypothetical protein EOS84_11820 [Mesorhizobium sp.]TIL66489.1 MAG: hypothetical protein E5Y77_16165 [Mesorhizobium sp.]